MYEEHVARLEAALDASAKNVAALSARNQELHKRCAWYQRTYTPGAAGAAWAKNDLGTSYQDLALERPLLEVHGGNVYGTNPIIIHPRLRVLQQGLGPEGLVPLDSRDEPVQVARVRF